MSGQGITTSVDERALKLLGSGIGPENVAAALGVSPSRISQLLSSEEFASKVADLRFQSLSKHNERDSELDTLEDTLIEKIKDLLPFMIRPMEVIKAWQMINSGKRRGTSTPEHITNQQTIINLVIPTKVVQRFTTNINNQVIVAGEQKLNTVQSGTLMDRIKEAATSLAALPAVSPGVQQLGAQRDGSERIFEHRKDVATET